MTASSTLEKIYIKCYELEITSWIYAMFGMLIYEHIKVGVVECWLWKLSFSLTYRHSTLKVRSAQDICISGVSDTVEVLPTPTSIMKYVVGLGEGGLCKLLRQITLNQNCLKC